MFDDESPVVPDSNPPPPPFFFVMHDGCISTKTRLVDNKKAAIILMNYSYEALQSGVVYVLPGKPEKNYGMFHSVIKRQNVSAKKM